MCSPTHSILCFLCILSPLRPAPVAAQHRAAESALIDARAEASALQAANTSAEHTVAQLTSELAEAMQQCKATQKALDDEMALRQARVRWRLY